MLGGNAAENCVGTNPATATPVHAFAADRASEPDNQCADERLPFDLANAAEGSESCQLGDAELGTVACPALPVNDEETAPRETATTNPPNVAAAMSDVTPPLATEVADITSATTELEAVEPVASASVAVEKVTDATIAIETEEVEAESEEKMAV